MPLWKRWGKPKDIEFRSVVGFLGEKRATFIFKGDIGD
jgi:hypothetical protein